jgi:hypothetical protein
MLVSVSRISGIRHGNVRHLGTLKFTACFDISPSTAYACGRAANFTDNIFAKRELHMNTQRKVKFVKTTLSDTRFVQITKSSEDLF